MTTNKSPNVDQVEIDKFDQVAHRWWDKDAEFKPLHNINPVRLQWVDTLAPLQGKKVLDVGCGGGLLSDAMAKLGASVLGIDLSKQALQTARQHAQEEQTPQIDYRQITVEELAQEQPEQYDVQYDIVTCMEMLEHVPDPQSAVTAIGKLVRPGGWVFLSSINRSIKAFMLMNVGAEYIAKLVPRGTHDYKKYIRPSELAQMANHAGLTLTEQTGVHYNPLTHQCKLIRDVSVNYMQAFRKN